MEFRFAALRSTAATAVASAVSSDASPGALASSAILASSANLASSAAFATSAAFASAANLAASFAFLAAVTASDRDNVWMRMVGDGQKGQETRPERRYSLDSYRLRCG